MKGLQGCGRRPIPTPNWNEITPECNEKPLYIYIYIYILYILKSYALCCQVVSCVLRCVSFWNCWSLEVPGALFIDCQPIVRAKGVEVRNDSSFGNLQVSLAIRQFCTPHAKMTMKIMKNMSRTCREHQITKCSAGWPMPRRCSGLEICTDFCGHSWCNRFWWSKETLRLCSFSGKHIVNTQFASNRSVCHHNFESGFKVYLGTLVTNGGFGIIIQYMLDDVRCTYTFAF